MNPEKQSATKQQTGWRGTDAFKERKAAQAAAFFLTLGGGRMPHLKLVKLLYLADREFLRRYAMPITWDRFVSMPHGPVPSKTYSLISGDVESAPDGWEMWVSDSANYEVKLKQQYKDRAQLAALSDAEVEVLEAIWSQFGRMTKWQIRDWTHENCKEWKDPLGSSIPLHYRDVFLALGHSREEASELSASLEESRSIERMFGLA